MIPSKRPLKSEKSGKRGLSLTDLESRISKYRIITVSMYGVNITADITYGVTGVLYPARLYLGFEALKAFPRRGHCDVPAVRCLEGLWVEVPQATSLPLTVCHYSFNFRFP